jgi:pimeloyl-ACP methyl ester carboxylesterase
VRRFRLALVALLALSFAIPLAHATGATSASTCERVAQTYSYTDSDGAHTFPLVEWLPGGSSANSRPAMLLVHGGGFDKGVPDDLDNLGKRFCDNGFNAYLPAYRLVCNLSPLATRDQPCEDVRTFQPNHPIEDLKHAVRSVRNSQSNQKVGVLGESAGAALAISLDVMDPQPDKPDAVAAWSGGGVNEVPWYFGLPSCSNLDARSCVGRIYGPQTALAAKNAVATFLGGGAADPRGGGVHPAVMYAAIQVANASLPADEQIPAVLHIYPTDQHGALLTGCAFDDTLFFLGAHLGVNEPDPSVHALQNLSHDPSGTLMASKDRIATCAATSTNPPQPL